MIMVIIGGAFMIAFSIFFHEFGHFVMGRLVGIRARVFSIGYGKGVWKKQIGDTTWQITAIPLGGYVRFYGDDIQEPTSNPGDFYSVSPYKRMVAVLGGPVFNLILGFFLFLLVHSIYGPLKPEVAFWEEIKSESPAFRDGLKEGDIIISINNEKISDFYDIKQQVAMSGGAPLTFKVKRDDKTVEKVIHPVVNSAGISYVGLRPPGQRSIEVNYPSNELWSYRFRTIFGDTTPPVGLRAMAHLNSGDVILEVEGERPDSVTGLQEILGRYHGQTVNVKVKREMLSWLAPWFHEEVEIQVPTSGEYRVNLDNITDLKYNEDVTGQVLVSSHEMFQRALGYISFDGEGAGSFEHMYKRFGSGTVRSTVAIDGRKYKADVKATRIGLMGFQARDSIEPEYMDRHSTFLDVIDSTFADTGKSIMIYPAFFQKLFSGRMSFVDNARGPLGMFAMAGIVFRSGLFDYLQLFAAISFALFVMNLLPFPVLDGGHLMFFIYEAIAGKPVSPAIMESIYRLGFTALLVLGLFIMYKDVIFFLAL